MVLSISPPHPPPSLRSPKQQSHPTVVDPVYLFQHFKNPSCLALHVDQERTRNSFAQFPHNCYGYFPSYAVNQSTAMIPTYHLAPNFSLGPPDKGGELGLGMICEDLKSLGSERPLNTDCHLHINDRDLYCHHKEGFSSTRAQMEKGEYGLWAKFAAQAGIGGELSWATERTANDTYNFKSIDTIYFNPTRDYLHKSMNQPDMQDFVVGSGYKPVYMITGLKIARSPAVKMKTSRKRILKGEIGLDQPGGIQGLEIGPRFSHSKETHEDISFDESDDFIIGFRVRRLYYKRWCFWKPAELVDVVYVKGATMLGADKDNGQAGEEVIGEEITESDNEMAGMMLKIESDDVGDETAWVVPIS